MAFDTSKIGKITVHSGDGDFEYGELFGTRHATAGNLTIGLKDRNPSQDSKRYDLAFAWSATADSLTVRGDFFEDSETTLIATLEKRTPYELTYYVYEPGGEDDPWVIEMELKSTGEEEDEEDVPRTTKPVDRLSSRSAALQAKVFKDRFKELATAVASSAPEVIDLTDGAARLYIKFLNGRTAQLERFDEVPEDERAEIFYTHWTRHVLIKKHWASVSAAIIFSVAFAFTFENEDGDEVELLLRRSPDDEHVADGFCEEILGGVQGELEELLNDDLKTTVEQGFTRLEKLILQSNKAPTESPARKPEKSPRPTLKKMRRTT